MNKSGAQWKGALRIKYGLKNYLLLQGVRSFYMQSEVLQKSCKNSVRWNHICKSKPLFHSSYLILEIHTKDDFLCIAGISITTSSHCFQRFDSQDSNLENITFCADETYYSTLLCSVLWEKSGINMLSLLSANLPILCTCNTASVYFFLVIPVQQFSEKSVIFEWIFFFLH